MPNLELAALCTRTEDRLAALGEKFGVEEALSRLSRHARRSGDRRGVDLHHVDQHTEPAIAALKAGKHRVPRKADRFDRSRTPTRSSPPRRAPRASCSSATSCASIRATAWPSRRSPRAASARWWRCRRAATFRPPGRPTILNKIGPIVGDAIHDTDIMLWLTGDRIVSAYAQTVDVRGLKHPDIGQTMFRFAGGATATLETVWCMPTKTPFDIDERMSIIGTEGIIHVQDTFLPLGIVDANKLHSPDITYWPMFDGRPRRRAARGVQLFHRLRAERHRRRRSACPEDAAAALLGEHWRRGKRQAGENRGRRRTGTNRCGGGCPPERVGVPIDDHRVTSLSEAVASGKGPQRTPMLMPMMAANEKALLEGPAADFHRLAAQVHRHRRAAGCDPGGVCRPRPRTRSRCRTA